MATTTPEQDKSKRGRYELVGTALLLLLTTIIPYLNTFHVPWYFDDIGNIVDNPLLRDLPRAARDLFMSRGVAIFTFALNYRWGGLDPVGFHVVNLAIHFLCVLTVWQLLRKLLGQDSFSTFVGAALFAVHPLQTQSVTYVVQRMTSLSGLAFFLAVYFYVLARGESAGQEGSSARRHNLYYVISIISGALAVLVKQNAAILPLALLLVDYFFLPHQVCFKKRLFSIAPFFIVPLLLAFHDVVLPLLNGAELWKIANQTSYKQVGIFNYFVTEFSVIWIYIRLLFLPFGQVFDRVYPVVEQLLNWKNLLAFFGLGALFFLAFRCRKSRPLVSFGIFWFFLGLCVESTFIPLDPYNEHRLYVPMFGFAFIMIDLLRCLAKPYARVMVACAILVFLMVMTWQRNALWADPVAFCEDNLRSTPKNVRIMVMLGNAYSRQERIAEALEILERATQIDPGYDIAYTAMGKIFIQQKAFDQAITVLLRGKEYNPDSARLNDFLGIAYGQQGEFQLSLRHFNRALMLKPDDANVYANMGLVCFWMGDDRQAVENFRQALKLVPDDDNTLFNYASALYNLGEKALALDALRAAVKINPQNSNAQYGRGSMAFALGLRQETIDARDALRRLGDARVRELDELLNKEVN